MTLRQSLSSQANSYDEIPYPAGAHPQTHPDHLAMIGTLFGMEPPSVKSCRVLELGCADGGNLIPMAENLPHAEFVGIDLSQRQVADGCALVEHLGLTNICVSNCSITDVDESFGQFDYILAHGVFSWVPHEVQECIFELCQQLLTPQGIAYISYNTYPGWRMRGMLRDMMLYHTRRFSDPHQQVQQARARSNSWPRKARIHPIHMGYSCSKNWTRCVTGTTAICDMIHWRKSTTRSTSTSSSNVPPNMVYATWSSRNSRPC